MSESFAQSQAWPSLPEGDEMIRTGIGLENRKNQITDLDQVIRKETFKGVMRPAPYGALKKVNS